MKEYRVVMFFEISESAEFEAASLEEARARTKSLVASHMDDLDSDSARFVIQAGSGADYEYDEGKIEL